MTWSPWRRVPFLMLTYPVLVGFAIGMRWHHRFKGRPLWWPGAIVIGIPVLVLDVVWVNWIVATVFWAELPREWTYSQRIGRLKRAGHAEAHRQCATLNRYDPDHC